MIWIYVSVPWMKVTQAQQDHKELTREIGKTLVGRNTNVRKKMVKTLTDNNYALKNKLPF